MVFPDPGTLAKASRSSILQVTQSLGLRWRTRFLSLLGKELAHLDKVPDNFSDLVSLPGVGPYVASAYLSFHRHRRGVLLDSNIVRFYGRLLGLPTGPETRRSRLFKELADEATPATETRSYNYAILDFTRVVCTPKPHCDRCPLQRMCVYGHLALKRKSA